MSKDKKKATHNSSSAHQTTFNKADTAQKKPHKGKKRNHHDIFFKKSFGLTSVVNPFLEKFMDDKFYAKLDTDSLEVSDTSYITDELSPYFADMVWNCRFKKSRLLRQIVFLFEHKSFKPTYPHFQLGDYLNVAYKKQAENKRKPLIPILPIILYHGRTKWVYKSYDSYFGTKNSPVDADMLRFLPSFDYILVNLDDFTDEIIKTIKQPLLQKTLLAFKHYNDKKYLHYNIGELWFGNYGSKKTEEMLNFIRFFGIYLSENLGMTRQQLFEKVKKADKNMKSESFEFVVDEFNIEGYQKGIHEGKEIGTEIGKEIGKEETTLQKNREFTINLLNTDDFDDERIAYLVGVDLEFVLMVKAELAAQKAAEEDDLAQSN